MAQKRRTKTKAKKKTTRRPARRTTAKAAKRPKAGNGRVATATKMRDQARALVDAQTAELVSVLRETESLTRQASLTEIDIANQRQVQVRMREELVRHVIVDNPEKSVQQRRYYEVWLYLQ